MSPVQPSGEMVAVFHKEVNENLKTRDDDLQHIREWLKQQPHLPDTWDDVRLLNFLRGCKFSLETCKKKLEMYFTMRTLVPEFFANRDVNRPELQEALRLAQIPCLPGLTPAGCRVYILRGTSKNEPPVFQDIAKAIFMVADVRLAEEPFGLARDICVVDTALASHSYLLKLTPTFLKKHLICSQDGYPLRVKEVHLINVSPIVDTMLAIIRPFVKQKIRDRIHIHAKLETFYKFVPNEMLPEDYGGNAKSMLELNNVWKEKIANYTDWFKEQDNVKSDESRRPGKSKSYSEYFGMEGSFRKLAID